jgi:Fe-S-cluster containining protein
METDLETIARVSREKEDENGDFQLFLKHYDVPIEALDAIVHRVHRDVSSRIDCTRCANCCTYFSPIFNESDIRRMSKGMGITRPEFEERYLQKNGGERGYVVEQTPCPFLESSLCSHYEYRPEACASFPHLHKADFVFRLMDVVNNYPICPIVYNVVEILKDELWTDRSSLPSRSKATRNSRESVSPWKRRRTRP